MRRRTLINILLILVVLSFFVTPLGHHGKILLNRIFSFSPEVIPATERDSLENYDWMLKDSDWQPFNFERSRGRVVFINFWASWRLPSEAELKSIQRLYDRYGSQMDFYIITNEERAPVEAFMEEHGHTFPITYLIIGEASPVAVLEPPASYVIDRNGAVVIAKEGIADWDNDEIYSLINRLISNEEEGTE